MSYLPIYLEVEGLSLSEKFSLSGMMLLRGMGTVFMVLIIVWAILSLFKVFSSPRKPAKIQKTEEKPKPAPAETKPAPAPKKEEAPAPAAKAEAPAQTADDGAVIAAICAAIEAYRAAEGLSDLPYRVVSFKRKTTGRKGWSGSFGNEE